MFNCNFNTQQPRQSPNDHLQDNTGIPYVPYDNNVRTLAPLYPTCNAIKWDITRARTHIGRNQTRATSKPTKQLIDKVGKVVPVLN
jgi:hypothetical protein